MTRTWFRVRDWPVFAWAGFCRRTEAWGPVYAALTTDSSPAVAALNPRMPVILAPEEYQGWLEGSIEDVIAFQFRPPFPAERLLVIARTSCGFRAIGNVKRDHRWGARHSARNLRASGASS